MRVLPTLIEQSDALRAERDAYEASLTDDKGEVRARETWTDAEAVRYAELDEKLIKLEDRINELNEAELREERVNAARSRVAAPAVVRNEARTYGPESPDNSYWADMAHIAFGGADPLFADAQARMAQHGKEMIRDAVNDSEFRKVVVAKSREQYRRDGLRARQVIADLESRRLDPRPEQRAGMDTTSASGGSFVTPQYLVQEWAPYRQFGRNFIDLTNLQPLPDYGMTVFIPQVTGPSAVAAQVGQNQGITETDPTAGYLSNSLITEAGQVVISQQLLDRAGPGIQFDKIVFDSLNRNYAQVIDAAVLAAVIAQSTGSVTNAANGGTGQNVWQSFLSDVAKATSNMETTQPTVMTPTHVHCTATEFLFLATQLDAYGRPYISNNGPTNAPVGGVDGHFDRNPEGDTGYNVGGVPIVKDSNIPASGSNTRILVTHMPEVYVWEGELVPRVIPQTFAQNLSVLLQVYTYYTVILRYTAAAQVISGNRYPAAPTFLQA